MIVCTFAFETKKRFPDIKLIKRTKQQNENDKDDKVMPNLPYQRTFASFPLLQYTTLGIE